MKMIKMFIIAVMAVFAISLTSCDEVKPEFQFDVLVSGNVQDAPTNIHSDFSVSVANISVATRIQTFSVDECSSIDSPQGEDALNWLNNYIQKNIIDEMGPKTLYEIVVTGYVKEVVSGITFSVDKVWRNRPEPVE